MNNERKTWSPRSKPAGAVHRSGSPRWATSNRSRSWSSGPLRPAMVTSTSSSTTPGRLARTKQRSHRSRVRRNLRRQRQGPVLPRRVTGTRDGRTRMGLDRQRQHDGRQLRAGRHGDVRREPSSPRTADEGMGRRIRPEWCSGQRGCARPDAHPDDGGSPEEMVHSLALLAPAGRVAEPEELAAAIVFVASDDASFVHGVTHAVDGGRVAAP